MLANYHTHTTRCNHATGTEREYIETAISNGFKILGFSDHVPQPYPSDYYSHIRMTMEETEGYVDTLVKLRDEYKDDIQILIGYEVEYTHKYFDKLLEHIRQYPLDYIIQGQHFIPDEIEGFYAGHMTDSEEQLKQYVDLTVEGMETGLFSYLAHPSLLWFEGPKATYLEHMKRIIDASIRLDIPLEVNMQGFLLDRNYPDESFTKLSADMGAKIVIGCDAHQPAHVMQPDAIPGFTDFLDRCGVEYNDNIIELRPI